MSKGLSLVVFAFALVLLISACDSDGSRFGTQIVDLSGGARILGDGDLENPRFAQSSGNFLTFTSIRFPTDILGSEIRGEPTDVYKAKADTLQVELVSKRVLGPGETIDSLPPDDVLLVQERAFETLVLANDDSFFGSVASTGDATAFVSFASNLLPPGDAIVLGINNAISQAYVADDKTGLNELVSITFAWRASGDPANRPVSSAMMSANRRYVTYATQATNIIPNLSETGISQIYVYDRAVKKPFFISYSMDRFIAANGGCFDPVISAAGRYIAFRTFADNLLDGDTNSSSDIYLWDRSHYSMMRVSIDGMVERFLDCAEPTISADGSTVVFSAVDATAGTSTRQIFAFDVATAAITLISKDDDGDPGNADSGAPAVSYDGSFICFETDASNLDDDDDEGFIDVFVYDTVADELTRVSENADGDGGNENSESPTISPDNSLIAFASRATNLLPEDAPLSAPGNKFRRGNQVQKQIILVPNPAPNG